MPSSDGEGVDTIAWREQPSVGLQSIQAPKSSPCTIGNRGAFKRGTIDELLHQNSVTDIAGAHQEQDPKVNARKSKARAQVDIFPENGFVRSPSERSTRMTRGPPFARMRMTASTITSTTSLSLSKTSSPNVGAYMTGRKYTRRLMGDGGSFRSPCSTIDAMAVPWTRGPRLASRSAGSSTANRSKSNG